MIVATTEPIATASHSSVLPRVGRMRYSPCTANASGKTIVTIGSIFRYVSSSCGPLVTGISSN
jgi:hypothetical protein